MRAPLFPKKLHLASLDARIHTAVVLPEYDLLPPDLNFSKRAICRRRNSTSVRPFRPTSQFLKMSASKGRFDIHRDWLNDRFSETRRVAVQLPQQARASICTFCICTAAPASVRFVRNSTVGPIFTSVRCWGKQPPSPENLDRRQTLAANRD